MANGENNGNTAGNRAINANTTVTIGLVVAVSVATGSAIWKASEVVSDLGYVKLYMFELRSEVAEMKRIINRMDRQQGPGADKKSDAQDSIQSGTTHIR